MTHGHCRRHHTVVDTEQMFRVRATFSRGSLDVAEATSTLSGACGSPVAQCEQPPGPRRGRSVGKDRGQHPPRGTHPISTSHLLNLQELQRNFLKKKPQWPLQVVMTRSVPEVAGTGRPQVCEPEGQESLGQARQRHHSPQVHTTGISLTLQHTPSTHRTQAVHTKPAS